MTLYPRDILPLDEDTHIIIKVQHTHTLCHRRYTRSKYLSCVLYYVYMEQKNLTYMHGMCLMFVGKKCEKYAKKNKINKKNNAM